MECLLDIFNPPETKSPTLYLNVANELLLKPNKNKNNIINFFSFKKN